MEIISFIPHISVPVTDPSQVGTARRAAQSVAEQLGFGEEEVAKVSIIVTEAGTNLARHAKHGEVLLCPVTDPGGSAHLDVLTIDRGPGIADLGRSMADGYSTSGTAGNGLGAIQRLSGDFDVYSDRGTGTVLLSRVYADKRSEPAMNRARFETGFVCIPKKGENLCGDTVAIHLSERVGQFMVADGLGHGIAANEASIEAGKIFSESPNSAPGELLQDIHHGLRGTRGAAVAVASFDGATGTIKYSGVGNIATCVLEDSVSRSLISHNGIVGHLSHKIQEFTYPWPTSALLIMNSDGLQTNWRLTPYPGLLRKDPAVIAAVLYRDFSRGRDDVSILVVRRRQDA